MDVCIDGFFVIDDPVAVGVDPEEDGEDDQVDIASGFVHTGDGGLVEELTKLKIAFGRDLQNPAVANYVQMIDNIVQARQFTDGGFNNGGVQETKTEVNTSTPTVDQDQQEALTIVINRLSDLLETESFARLDDDTFIDLENRINELNDASGGILR